MTAHFERHRPPSVCRLTWPIPATRGPTVVCVHAVRACCVCMLCVHAVCACSVCMLCVHAVCACYVCMLCFNSFAYFNCTNITFLCIHRHFGNTHTLTHTHTHARRHARTHARTHTHTHTYERDPKRVTKENILISYFLDFTSRQQHGTNRKLYSCTVTTGKYKGTVSLEYTILYKTFLVVF